MTPDTPTHPVAVGLSDRREFLRCAACGLASVAALSLPGCGGDSPAEPKTPPKVPDPINNSPTTPTGEAKFEISGNTIKVFLSRIPSLVTPPGVFLIDVAQTIVVRTSTTDYGAVTSVCTHEGCGITGFTDGKLSCLCHGSQFELDGAVFMGPAAAPLQKYSVSLNTTTNELTITKP